MPLFESDQIMAEAAKPGWSEPYIVTLLLASFHKVMQPYSYIPCHLPIFLGLNPDAAPRISAASP